MVRLTKAGTSVRVGGRSGWCGRCAAVGVAAGQGGRGTRADEGERASGRGGSCTDRVRCQLMVLLDVVGSQLETWRATGWHPIGMEERAAGEDEQDEDARGCWQGLAVLDPARESVRVGCSSAQQATAGGGRSEVKLPRERGERPKCRPRSRPAVARCALPRAVQVRRLTHTTRCGHRQGAPRAESTLTSTSLVPVARTCLSLCRRSAGDPLSSLRNEVHPLSQGHAPSSLQHRLTGRAAAPRASPRRRGTGCAS